MNSYPRDYIDDCRARIDARLAAYRQLVTAIRAQCPGDALDTAIEAFAPAFFDGLVLTLDMYFTHRSRTIEGKDGNPINEVRILCNSMVSNDGVFSTDTAANAPWNSTLKSDRAIRYRPETSVLGYEPGDRIALHEDEFRRLCDAYFAAIGEKFG